MKISIAPIPYFWKAQDLHDFYAALPPGIDAVYLGETVCSKRRALRFAEWLELARSLATRFPQVLLSTLTLIEAESELGAMRRLCENDEFMVEANDYAAVSLLTERKLPFVAGPFLNVYNARSLALLQDAGACRWVPPAEMSGNVLRELLSAFQGTPPQTELLAYGRLPLAHSARCFTARAQDRNKDNCEFICGNYRYGLPLTTHEQAEFLRLNGIQVQSGAVHAVTDLAALQASGVDMLRLMPADDNFMEVLAAFREAIDAMREVRLPHPTVDGYWQGVAGMSGS